MGGGTQLGEFFNHRGFGATNCALCERSKTLPKCLTHTPAQKNEAQHGPQHIKARPSIGPSTAK